MNLRCVCGSDDPPVLYVTNARLSCGLSEATEFLSVDSVTLVTREATFELECPSCGRRSTGEILAENILWPREWGGYVGPADMDIRKGGAG